MTASRPPAWPGVPNPLLPSHSRRQMRNPLICLTPQPLRRLSATLGCPWTGMGLPLHLHSLMNSHRTRSNHRRQVLPRPGLCRPQVLASPRLH